MANLYRHRITFYVDTQGNRVPKGTPGAKQQKKMSKKWYTRIKDERGKWLPVPLSVNKDAARIMASKLIEKRELAKVGVYDRHEEHRKVPLAKHLQDWETSLTAQESTAKHVQMKLSRAKRIIDHCQFVFLADLSASKVEACLGEFRKDARFSVQTNNHYLAAIKQFTRWLHRDKRIADDPLQHLQRGNVALDRRHDRRELADAEMAWLFQAAQHGPILFKLTGPDRAMLYAVAAFTGLRANELASLHPKSFNLEQEPPTLTVEAGYSKRRRQDVLPLHPDLVDRLATWLVDKPTESPLWPGSWASRNHAGKLMKADLAAARSLWIANAASEQEKLERNQSDFLAFVDGNGRYADFHSLRHTFITRLVKAGVKPKVAQALARHSTITLTMDRYTHLELDDAVDGMAQLANLPRASKQNVYPLFVHENGFQGKQARAIEREQPKLLTNETVQKPLENRAKKTIRDQSNSGEEGIRTLDALAGISVFETDAALTQVLNNKRRYGKQPVLVVHRVVHDEELSRLIVAWPTLPRALQQAISAIVDTATLRRKAG